jgi:hypothetical protein
MANVSLSDLTNRVAQKLGLIAVGQDVNADDGDLIGQTLTDLQEQMAVLQFGFFNFDDGVEPAYADPVAQMAAAHLVDEFGVPEPKRSQLVSMGALGIPGRSLAERRIRDLAGSPTTKLVTVSDVTPI